MHLNDGTIPHWRVAEHLLPGAIVHFIFFLKFTTVPNPRNYNSDINSFRASLIIITEGTASSN